MKGLTLIPYKTKIDFMKQKNFFFAFSVAVLIGSLVCLCMGRINYGLDFKGGLLVEARLPKKMDFSLLRTQLDALKIGEVKLQEFGEERDIVIRLEEQKGGEEAQLVALDKIKGSLGEGVEYRRVETVGPKVSHDLIQNAFFSILWATLGIVLYIWFRFEWQFGVCALLALAHDAVAIVGFYGMTRFEFNEASIIAILTTLGYSINDTVVIYDRIRENLPKFKKMSLPDILNLSINETLSRTILTSSTTLISLLCLYFFGGSVLAGFTLPIIVGIVIGTFSSICVAAPLLTYFKIYRGEDAPLPVREMSLEK